MTPTKSRIYAAVFVCSCAAAFAACSEPDLFLFAPAQPDAGAAGGGGDGGAGGQDAGPSGCDGCGGATPICVDGDHCAAACPDGRPACDTAGDSGPTACCTTGEQCCEAELNGYAGGDLCRPAGEACPVACPGGAVACPAGEYCMFDPDANGYTCAADCTAESICDGNLCCPLGSRCTGGACPLADLTVDEGRLSSSVEVVIRTFAADSCEMFEGCIAAPGTRTLMRFDLRTPNIGQGDLHLGDPDGNPLFQFSPCHNHYHFNGYARYRLLDGSGQEAGTGHKQAFCLLDFEPNSPNAPPGYYSCGNQGIQADWSDIYSRNLACQWVDVTGVPPGNYTLEVRVNDDHTLAESDYANNVAAVAVSVPANTCPNGCRAPDAACCQAGDPCGWGADGSCDCAGYFSWDNADCSSCVSSDPDCDFTNSCPGGCTPNSGACCDPTNPCGLANNGSCDCGGAFDWDTAECIDCVTNDPDCPVNTCPNGCTPYNPNNGCCGASDTCGWAGDGWCDCGGQTPWDAADCAVCISADPDCP